MKRKNLSMVGILVAIVLGITSPLLAADTYKIGAALPLTGPAQFLGEAEREAMNMAVDEINEKGGVNGQKLEVIYIDTKADVNTALSVVEKLMSLYKVPVIITTDSNSALATMDNTEKAKVVHLSVARADTFTEKGYKYCFRNQPTNKMLMDQYMKDMASQLRTKKLAILVANYPYGLSALDGLKKAKLPSVDIVHENKFPMETTDFTPYLTPIKGSGADTIALICVEKQAIGVVTKFMSWSWTKPASGFVGMTTWWKRRCSRLWATRRTACTAKWCITGHSTRWPRISTILSRKCTARNRGASSTLWVTRTSMPSTTASKKRKPTKTRPLWPTP
jgi:hypothetical protein